MNQTLAELCRRALTLLDGTGPGTAVRTGTDRLRARVEAQLSCVLLELEQLDEAERWSGIAYRHAVAAGDAEAELDALRARVPLESRPGNDALLAELGGRALELAEQTHRPLARLWAHVWRSDAAIHRADLAAARREVTALEVLADRTGLPLVRWHLLRRRATLAALAGEFDRSRRLAEQAADVARDWGDPSVYASELGQAIHLAALRGDPDDLAPGWTDLLSDGGRLPPVGKVGVAQALLLTGRRDEAEALYRAVLPLAADVSHWTAAATLVYLTQLAPALRDSDGCRLLHRVLRTSFGDALAMGAGTVIYTGSIARTLGDLALGYGDAEAAVDHYRVGLEVDGRLEARPYLAHGRLGLARALLGVGDLAGAAEQARIAADQARRLDLPGPLRASEGLLAGLTVQARTADPLSRREREVLGLVAQALTNREIAARLVLSERTVESHVRRILAKTGLTTRTELTRWFLGLPDAGDRTGPPPAGDPPIAAPGPTPG